MPFIVNEGGTNNLFSGASQLNTPQAPNINIDPKYQAAAYSPSTPAGFYPTKGDFLQNSDQGQTSSISTGGAAPTPSFGVYGSAAGANAALSEIDQAYNDSLTAYQNQENETVAQRDLSLQRLGTQNQQALASVGEAQQGQIQSLDQSAGSIKSSSTNAVNDARRAFNELTGRNNARLSASGLNSSSVADAMQEKLSRNTFAALDQISQNRESALQNIESTKAKANEFYQRQKADLATALSQAQTDLQNQFTAALNRINEARNISAQQKQQARNQVQAGLAAAYQAAQAKAAEYQHALDLHNYATTQATNAINQFTQGNYSPDQVLQNFNQINQKLRGNGYTFDANSWINHITNPYSAGGNFIQPVQAPVLGQAGLVRYDPVTGKQI